MVGADRIAVLSLHTSPLARPGGGDAGGMNVYVRALARNKRHWAPPSTFSPAPNMTARNRWSIPAPAFG